MLSDTLKSFTCASCAKCVCGTKWSDILVTDINLDLCHPALIVPDVSCILAHPCLSQLVCLGGYLLTLLAFSVMVTMQCV